MDFEIWTADGDLVVLVYHTIDSHLFVLQQRELEILLLYDRK